MAEPRGIMWAGDVWFGYCSACGKPAAGGPDGWWHSYAAHIVDCRAPDAVLVIEGTIDPSHPVPSEPPEGMALASLGPEEDAGLSS